jgi:uncharacterized membrane protein
MNKSRKFSTTDYIPIIITVAVLIACIIITREIGMIEIQMFRGGEYTETEMMTIHESFLAWYIIMMFIPVLPPVFMFIYYLYKKNKNEEKV